MTARVLCAVVLLAAGTARAADTPMDPDTQAARRHFERGIELYQEERYEEAIREFEQAKQVKLLPAFDYNIGRCNERLERWRAAADSYDRYLAAAPGAPEKADLTARIQVLRSRSAAPPVSSSHATATVSLVVDAPARQPHPRPVYKRGWFWGVVASGVVVVAVGVALGVTLGGSHGDPSHPIPGVGF